MKTGSAVGMEIQGMYVDGIPNNAQAIYYMALVNESGRSPTQNEVADITSKLEQYIETSNVAKDNSIAYKIDTAVRLAVETRTQTLTLKNRKGGADVISTIIASMTARGWNNALKSSRLHIPTQNSFKQHPGRTRKQTAGEGLVLCRVHRKRQGSIQGTCETL